MTDSGLHWNSNFISNFSVYSLFWQN